ncbi:MULTISPECIES: cytochrome o ubiquinol oxidase subunit IV [Sphingomonas]|mgnify:FL=1|jgi:cytochrome o ubiquinol oxidase subunit IV|uniref:Cytochrome bo(3) ubiquinol oxidase subunit 4 n=1 Tax=Sphingomonas zeae TaxID=1646122 RepID=A0A7Y6B7J0_9SPHN|nr:MULTISPECIES: cytochrome o ubiquinol oxidase subunit IV [Sphingomonas]MBB4046758.1 cytochrome o ubiquinol oxidase operon protein cyoD [Sphingomonas zeae]MDK8184534.1 cytochrome o ubiquinol oxidase subunit IV [Sphingomonas zeae]MDK8214377.1 cytochrome o ubiquinol oxidase subunit IV [Sphingomonas sp. UMB7805-LC452B]NUU48866.1 cytochrome o ubiquinol oxidase subunit IV [Sphingomonas zeae]
MSERPDEEMARDETAPGEESEHDSIVGGVRSYAVGLVAAAILTAASFALVQFDIVWGPAVPAALVALAIGQMGVHLVFFLHITTGPDNSNNVLALLFGVLIVALVLLGSIWIMGHLNHNLMGPMATP